MLPDSAVEEIFEDLIEDAAGQLIDDYRTFAGSFHLPVPVESIAEHFLKYELEITDEGLFADPLFLGGISFETRTIFVNAAIEGHEGRYIFTIAHEIGHHVLHRDTYDALVADRNQILCREAKKKPLIERQADRFAAALIMPRALIRDAINGYGPQQPETLGEALHLAAHLQTAGGFRNVSVSAIVNRLKDLSLIHGRVPYQTGTGWRHARREHPASVMLQRVRRWIGR